MAQAAVHRNEDAGAMEEAIIKAPGSSQVPSLQALKESTRVVHSCCSRADVIQQGKCWLRESSNRGILCVAP